VFIGVSLDGKIARRDGNIDWLTDQPAGRDHVPGHQGPAAPAGYQDFMAATDHIVMGRATYQKVLSFDIDWPYRDQQVIVLSKALESERSEHITVVRSVGEACQLLNSRDARGVYVDGGQVIQSFLRAGFIDEMIISVAPVIIGDGIPLFGAVPEDILLTHLGSSYNESGMTSSRYAVNYRAESPLGHLEREGSYTPAAAASTPWQTQPDSPKFSSADVDVLLDEVRGDH